MLHGAGQVDDNAEINKPSLQHYTSSVQGYGLPSLIRWMTASSTQHNHWTHLIFCPEKGDTERQRSIVAYAAHKSGDKCAIQCFWGQIANTWAEDEHRKFPASLKPRTQLAGTWNINRGCIPSEWAGEVLKGEGCLTERLMYAPWGLNLVRKTGSLPSLALTLLSRHALILPTCDYSSALIFFSDSLKVFFSHLAKRRQ